MKHLMKSLLALSIMASLCVACNNYGKKIKVEGTKGEIFYKGEGVTESDAKKLGDYLVKEQFLKGDKAASVQLTKEGEAYLVRFVYNKDFYDKTPGLDEIFKKGAIAMSKEIFDNKKVNIALSDSLFKDFKSIPYDEAFAKSLEAAKDNEGVNTADATSYGGQYDSHMDKASGIKFFWKNPVTDKEAELIGKAVIATGAFTTTKGNVHIVMEKDGDRYLVKFPIAPDYQTNAAYLAKIDPVAKEIKDAAFANVPYSFVVVDEDLKAVKSYDY